MTVANVLFAVTLMLVELASNVTALVAFKSSTQARCPTPYCTCDELATIRCAGFISFAELRFNGIDYADTLDLEPDVPLVVDDSLDLANMRIGRLLVLRNINGFLFTSDPLGHMVASSSPTSSPLELKLINSTFAFFDAASRPLSASSNACTPSALAAVGNTTILSHFGKLWLNDEHVRYAPSLCPLVFANTRIEFVLLHLENTTNMLSFADRSSSNNTNNSNHSVAIATDDEYINAHISFLYLYNTKLSALDTRLLDKRVFANLASLQLFGTLGHIQPRLFDTYTRLRCVILDLYNFEAFALANPEWTTRRQLQQQQEHARSLVVVHLNDRQMSYTFPDAHFCHFRHYDTSERTLYVINGRERLPCTCTLIWLLKEPYKRLIGLKQRALNDTQDEAAQESEQVRTRSVSECFAMDDDGFEASVANCQFERRVQECYDDSHSIITTTTTRSANERRRPINASKIMSSRQASVVGEMVFISNVDYELDQNETQTNGSTHMANGTWPIMTRSDRSKPAMRKIATIAGAFGFASITAILSLILFYL